MADEGNSHLDSRAIKVRLRKPKKRLARKEWNLIRNSCALLCCQAAMKKRNSAYEADTWKEIERKSVAESKLLSRIIQEIEKGISSSFCLPLSLSRNDVSK